ncbi:hypothetical protein Tco_1320002 [Tanacetum coccineum]
MKRKELPEPKKKRLMKPIFLDDIQPKLMLDYNLAERLKLKNMSMGGLLGLKVFLMLFGVTTALIDVNAAQSKLVLLENFNENYSKFLRLLAKLQLPVQSYYC